MSTDAFRGARYLLQGLELIRKRELRLFVIIPILINLAVFAVLVSIGIHYFDLFSLWVQQWLPSWLQWLKWLLWFLFGLFSLLLAAYTFTLFTNLIATPFNNLLAEKVEVYLTGQNPISVNSWVDILKSLPRSLIRQFQLLIYYLTRSAILLILSFIPVVHIVAVIAWFFFTAWMLTIQYIDYPMDNNQISFATLRKALRQKRLTSLGFGITATLFTMVPLLNVLIMPAAVAGATIMWVNEYRQPLLLANKQRKE